MMQAARIPTPLLRHVQGARMWAFIFLCVWCASSYRVFDSTHIYTGDFAAFLEAMVIQVLLLLVWVGVWVAVEQAFKGYHSVALHVCIGAALLAADTVLTGFLAPWLFYALAADWRAWISDLCSAVLMTVAIESELTLSLKSRSRRLLKRLSVVAVLLGCFAIYTYAQYQRDERPPVMSLNAHADAAWVVKPDQPVLSFLNNYFAKKQSDAE